MSAERKAEPQADEDEELFVKLPDEDLAELLERDRQATADMRAGKCITAEEYLAQRRLRRAG